MISLFLVKKSDPMLTSLMLKHFEKTKEGNMIWKSNIKAITDNFEEIFDWSDYGTFEGPVKLIGGSKSKYLNVDNCKKVFTNLNEKNVIWVEGAGHWVQAQEPALVAKEIGDFVKDFL